MPRTPYGRRALAVAAAAGLLASLFAPWYRETVIARGLTGPRTLTLTRSGWQAFSSTQLLLVIAALATIVVVLAPGSRSAGRPDRLRLSGALIGALGAIVVVVVLMRLSNAPGTTRHALAQTTVGLRWGIFLALGCGAGLAAAGLWRLRAPRTPGPGERPPAAAPRPRRRPAVAPAAVARRSEPPQPAGRADRGPDRARWEEPATRWPDLPD